MLFWGVIGIKILDSLIRNTVAMHPLGILDFVKNAFTIDCTLKFWGAWFIGAIFTARIIFFLLARVSNNDTMLAFLLITFAIGGSFLERCSIPNVFWHQQGMVLCIFIWIGTQLKKFDLTTRQLLILGGLYVVSFIVLQPIGLNTIDSFCSMYHTPDIYHLPLSVYMGTLGTCLVLGISKAIGKCNVLSFVGINSAVMVYC